MAKKKKFEKVTEIVKADSYGNVTTQKLTGNTGGYTRETTPALVAASQTVKPTVKPAMANVTQTAKPTQTVKNTINTVNADGYTETNKKYGDYKYQDYANKKDYKVYKKDGKSYYYNENTKQYVDMDTPTMTSAEQDKKDYNEAVKQGFKGESIYKIKETSKLAKGKQDKFGSDSKNKNRSLSTQNIKSKEKQQVLPTKIADRVELDTSDLSKEEKQKYAKDLIRQEKDRDKDLSYVRRGGAGLQGTIGELQHTARNIDENFVEPLARAPESYDYGKLAQQQSLEYYKAMMGKKNNLAEINKKIEKYNKFNKDIIDSKNEIDSYFKNLPNQIGGMKAGIENAGILGAAGGIVGGGLGAIATRTPQGALAAAQTGAKLLGGAGYVKGQAENTFKLESGATYQTLLDMGVPEDIAKQEALRVGTENALIESGESLVDLLTLGKGSVAIDKLKDGLIKKYGVDFVKNLGKSYAGNIVSEGLEEGTQEQRTIAGEKRAANRAGIERDSSQDVNRILQSAKSGAIAAGISGGATRTLGMTGGSAMKTVSNAAMTRVKNLNPVEREALTGVAQKIRRGEQLDEQDIGVIGVINSKPIETVGETQPIQETQNMVKNQQNTVPEPATNTIENSNNLEYNNTTNTKEGVDNDFRRLQEASRGLSKEQHETLYRGDKSGIKRVREDISRVLQPRMESIIRSNNDSGKSLKNGFAEVNNNDFQEIFEVNHPYLRNPDTVSVYGAEDYKNNKNYLSDDGLSGFSITPSGDLISVFNNSGKPGMLQRISDTVKAEAKTLDCFSSKAQDLPSLYQDAFGLKVASIMDFNYDIMAEEHGKEYADAFVEKYGEAPVYFMVKSDKNVTPKHFNKDQYDEAEAYRNSFVDKEGTSNSSFSNEISPDNNKKPEEGTKQNKSNSTESIKEIRKEVEEKTNKTMSKHIETSSKATNTVDDIKNMNYDDIVYDEKTHKASQEQALRELEGKDIDTNINDVHTKFRGTERLTNVDSAKITELMKQTKSLADEAAKNNNDAEYNKRMEQFRTLKGDYAVALSESGQFIEYAKVIKELDPETQIDVLNKVIDREKRRGNKKYEDVTINEKLVEKYKKAKTDEERDAIMEEIKDDTARQIKITMVDKLNEFRFLSMLGNFKTHGRNLFGNGGMYSLQSFKDGVAAIGEDIYDKTSKNGLETRSKTLKPATKEVSKYVSDTVDSFMKNQKSKYSESSGMKGDLEGRTKKFNNNNIIGKALNKASNLNSKALDIEDKFFTSKMTKKAMKGFLTANGIETNADIEAHPELVAQALDYALFKGKEATFHQDSTTATAIRNTRDKLYTGSGFSKLGGLAIDASLPFVSTPANIAKNALEYTPIIGFGNINKHIQQAPNNMKANVFIDSLSKQFTGGALMAVGAYLASQGLVKGSGDDDKEDKTEASLGNASYSIKIGNSTYDLSWLAPTAIPFFEGVEVFNAFKKANSKGGIKATDTADLIDTLFGTLNPMTDMSVLQSIERVITSITYGGNAVKSATSTTFSSYLQQYIPTLLSQIAQTGDTKQRNTNTGANVLEKTWDQIKYKIPGARNTLPEKVDVWGNANKTADNLPQRMFEAFLSPANRKDYKVDKTTKELERLARETDDTAMLPTVKNKSLRVNGKDYDLKGKDYVNIQKTYGKTAKKNLDELIKSDSYKNADDAEKQSMVRKIYDYASYKAKENYAKNKGINFDSGNQTSFAMIDAFEIPYEKYVENKVSGNESATKILDKLNGAALSEVQKGAVMNYFDRAYYVDEDELYSILENSNLSNKQKELVRTKYENNITDTERERYKRADNIGVDYDLYANFRSFVASARGESRSGGPTKKQKVINWIQEQELTAKQKQNLYNDYINNQGIFSYYK